MHQTWLRMKIRPRTAFCYWLSSPRRRGPELDPSLHSCEMKPFQSLSLRAETNKDNYRQRIHFILAATSVSWGSTCSIQRWLVCWDYLPPLLCYLFITCSRALSNSYYTVGPGAAWASRTKLCISDLKPCSFGPSVSSWREKREGKKKCEKRIEKGGGGEGGGMGEREEKRERAAVGEYRSSSILMCANSPAPAD